MRILLRLVIFLLVAFMILFVTTLLVGQSRFEHEVRAHANECDYLSED